MAEPTHKSAAGAHASAPKDSEAASRGAYLIDIIDRLRDGREVFFNYVRYVGDVMDRTFTPVTLDQAVSEAWKRFERDGIVDIPVIDLQEADRRAGTPEKRVSVGTIRKKDISALVSQYAGSLAQQDSDDKVLSAAIGQYVARGLPTLTADVPLADAINAMLHAGLESMAVVNAAGDYLGAFTSVSVMKCFSRLDTLRKARATDKPQEETRVFDLLNDRGAGQSTDIMIATVLGKVQDVMNASVPKILADDRVEDAIKLMEQKKSSLLVVVDKNDAVKGVLTDMSLQAALPPMPQPKRSAKPTGVEAPVLFDFNNKETKKVLAAKVSIAMQAKSASVSPEDSIMKVVETLSATDLSVIPVADPNGGKIKGAISRADLLRLLVALGQLAEKRGLIDNK